MTEEEVCMLEKDTRELTHLITTRSLDNPILGTKPEVRGSLFLESITINYDTGGWAQEASIYVRINPRLWDLKVEVNAPTTTRSVVDSVAFGMLFNQATAFAASLECWLSQELTWRKKRAEKEAKNND